MPDFVATKRPGYRPDWSTHPHGMDALGGDDPFIMEADGKCQLFVPSGLKAGPLPTYYEPAESPVHNPVYDQQSQPGCEAVDQATNCMRLKIPAFPMCLSPIASPNYIVVM